MRQILPCSAAFMISAGFPPQSKAETQTLTSRTAFSSRFFDEGVYILLRKTHLSYTIPYRLHCFFKRLVNYLFEHNRVVYSYCQDFFALLEAGCFAYIRRNDHLAFGGNLGRGCFHLSHHEIVRNFLPITLTQDSENPCQRRQRRQPDAGLAARGQPQPDEPALLGAESELFPGQLH